MGEEPITAFEHANIWQFTVDEVVRSETPTSIGRTIKVKAHTRSIGVLATNMDAAYAKLRSLHPNVRIKNVIRHDIPIHYVVDNPEAMAVAAALEK